MEASRAVDITYVPADCGSIIYGKSKAPQAFRSVGIVNKLKSANITVTEHEALDKPATYSAAAPGPTGVRNESLNVSVCKQVERAITSNFAAHNAISRFPSPPFQLILGGECGMSPGILSAFWRNPPMKRVGFVYIDADTDLYSPKDPHSIGTFASMNMTNLLRAPGALASMEEFSRPNGAPLCNADNTVFFGTNMVLPGNRPEHFAYLFDHGFKVVSAKAVAEDPEGRAREALRYLEDRVDVILVHLDVDAIDPGLFPLANVPNFTGTGFEEMMRALRVFLGSEKVGGLTIAEVNPDHDPGLLMVERLTDRVVGMLATRGVKE